jgi:hypothetical protein
MSQFAFDPKKTPDYRLNRIEEDRFHSWSKDNMWRTSYANSYTDVHLYGNL